MNECFWDSKDQWTALTQHERLPIFVPCLYYLSCLSYPFPFQTWNWYKEREGYMIRRERKVQARQRTEKEIEAWTLVSFPLTVILCLLCSITSFTLCISWSKGSSNAGSIMYWFPFKRLLREEWYRMKTQTAPRWIKVLRDYWFHLERHVWLLLESLSCLWTSTNKNRNSLILGTQVWAFDHMLVQQVNARPFFYHSFSVSL